MTISMQIVAFATVLGFARVQGQQEPVAASIHDNCSFHVESEALICSLRTLNSKDADSISASRAEAIEVKCSDVFFYESFLRTNHFGYLPELKKLDMEFCKIRKIPSLAFSGLSALTGLTISSRNSEWSAMMMEIESDALTGLDSLKSLNLSQNNIWTLPSVTFCELRSLEVLNLSYNFLQDINDLSFSAKEIRHCELPIKTLDLSFNSFSALPTKALSQLPQLQSLSLNGNNLNRLQDDAFDGLNAVTRLNLANNNLITLPPNLFSQMPLLRELYLENNSLSALPPGLFDNLPNLLVLNLSRNELSNDGLDSKTFSSLTNLVALDLSFNRLSKVDKHLFASLQQVQIINLRHNKIHTVEPHAFSNQVNLHILYLSYNNLESLHAKSIQHLPRLSSLSLDHNKLENLRRNFLRNCSNLQDLAIHNNKLSSLPSAIKSLSLLRTLDLGDNSIHHVEPEAFAGLDNLYGLRLAGNGIAALSENTFVAVPTLQVLNLAHNHLTKLEHDTLNPLTKLKMLRLDNNSLKDINGLLTQQSELRWLNISANSLQWFDFGSIPKSVRWLDLHQNQLEELGNYYELKEGFSLESLDVSQNRITKLTPLSLVDSLEYVLLNDNNIEDIANGAFAEKVKLRRVELKSNRLRKPSLSAFAVKPSLDGQSTPEFYIGGNPLVCDCDMEWLQKINQIAGQSRAQYPRIMDLDDIECSLVNKGGKSTSLTLPLMEVQSNQFLCQYKAHCFALCKCCDFFACDCRMQCPQGCDCFHDSTWSSNVIQCSRKEHAVIPPLIPMDATSIYLDGNNFTGILESQVFIGRKRVLELYLNASRIESITNQTFNGLTELRVLNLAGNFITRLEGHEFQNLTSLMALNLQDNRINYIGENTFSTLHSLQVIRLDGNRLRDFPIWNLRTLPNLRQIWLSGNAWSCDCEFVQNFQHFVNENNSPIIVADLVNVQCIVDESHLPVLLSNNVTCSDALAVKFQEGNFWTSLFPILVAIIAIIIVVIISSVILFVFRTPLRVWLHSKYGVRFLDTSLKDGRGKLYDAFVSYSLKDDDFVQQVLVPNVEHEEPGHKLCLQHRDMPSSSSIAEAFPGISHLCAKHILVVTKAYLSNEWKQIKFALQGDSSAHRSLRPIIVLLEDLSTLDLAAAPEFNLLMKTAVILKWNEPGFWNKLRYFLPDNVGRLQSPAFPRSINASSNAKRQYESPYDAIIPSNNSSTSTRSTIMGGSPRNFNGDNNAQNNNLMQLVANPVAPEWSDPSSDSVYSWQEHTYHTISHGQPAASVGGDNVYHTLEQQGGEAVGSVDVMLPNGRLVPATLFRNASGKVVPLVLTDPGHLHHQHLTAPRFHREPPPLSEERTPLRQEHVLPKTMQISRGKGHLV